MATPLKGEMQKDTQIKPAYQINEPDNAETLDPLGNSKMYQDESKAILL